jgi:hypothetical protein
LELTVAEWDEVHNVNLKGSFVVAQAVARRMITNGCKGAIVNLSSSSVRGHVLGAHYAGSKAGIIGLCRFRTSLVVPAQDGAVNRAMDCVSSGIDQPKSPAGANKGNAEPSRAANFHTVGLPR